MMPNNINLYILLLGIIILLILLTFVLCLEISKVIQRLLNNRSTFKESFDDSKQIVESAKYFSDYFVNDFKKSEEELLKLFNDQLDATSKRLIEKFEATVSNMDLSIESSISQYQKNVSDNLTTFSNKFQSDLENKITTNTKNLEEKIEQSFSTVNASIKDYEIARKKAIKSNINHIIQDISLNTIGVSIDLKTHEDLIIKKLDQLDKTQF